MSNKVVRRNISQKSELITDLHDHNINPDSRELYIHGAFQEEDPGVDFRMCSTFIKNLNFLYHTGKDSPILIHQITTGGEWDYGMAMYDAIKGCTCPTTVLVYAHATSMSSIILQAADYRVMMPNSHFMLHEGSCGAQDTQKGFLTLAEEMKRIHEVMLDIYVNRAKSGEAWAGKTDTYIRKAIQAKFDAKQEWYLTARDAVKYGFADAVLGDEGYENLEVLLKYEV